jgi:polyisoprenoid-binding protein YceI
MKVSQLMIGMFSLVLLARVGMAAAPAAAEQANKVEKKEPAPVPVPLDKGKAALTPKNSTIQFVGTHVGPEPNPRTGYFMQFKGVLAIDEATKTPTAASIEIETKSLITPIGKLTNHLQSPDFFDARKYPKASFKSTKFEPVDAASGKYKVTGELSIRDKKKTITFPAEVKLTDASVLLSSKFKLKRSDFGMTFGPDRVVDEVAMTIEVGKPTPKVEVE